METCPWVRNSKKEYSYDNTENLLSLGAIVGVQGEDKTTQYLSPNDS